MVSVMRHALDVAAHEANVGLFFFYLSILLRDLDVSELTVRQENVDLMVGLCVFLAAEKPSGLKATNSRHPVRASIDPSQKLASLSNRVNFQLVVGHPVFHDQVID